MILFAALLLLLLLLFLFPLGTTIFSEWKFLTVLSPVLVHSHSLYKMFPGLLSISKVFAALNWLQLLCCLWVFGPRYPLYYIILYYIILYYIILYYIILYYIILYYIILYYIILYYIILVYYLR